MKTFLYIGGWLLILIGLTWILQGVNVLPCRLYDRSALNGR